MRAGGCKRPDPVRFAAHPTLEQHPRLGAHLEAHRSGAAPLPTEADKLGPSPTSSDGLDLDQGQSGSCVWGSLSDAIFTSCRSKGTPLGFVPSQDTGYKATRALERRRDNPSPATLPDLTDAGSDPEDALEIAATMGVEPMKVEKTPDGRFYDVWTDDDVGPGNGIVNQELELRDVEAAAATKVKVDPNAHTINPADPALSDLLAAALSASPALCIEGCGTVNAAFEQLTADQVAGLNECDPNGVRAGGHAWQLRKYRTNPTTGEREFFLKNSWGRWAAVNGVWVSLAFLAKSWGFWVIDPELVKEAA